MTAHRWLPFDRRMVLTRKSSVAAMFGHISFIVRCAACGNHFTARFWSHTRRVEVRDGGTTCRAGR